MISIPDSVVEMAFDEKKRKIQEKIPRIWEREEFTTRQSLKIYAKCRGKNFYRMHRLVKTRYFSLSGGKWIKCWTLVLR